MKRVLVIYYSQSGQLERVIRRFTAPLFSAPDIQCDYWALKPLEDYPYPWPLGKFFNVFPEAVALDGCAIEQSEPARDYDLIILGYTVWFLSPSIPIAGFLNSEAGRLLLKNKPVITVIACRDMWLSAQEKVKARLHKLGARLLDNVVLTDQGSSLYTFVTTPRWLLTGKKNSFLWFPPAGIAENEIAAATRFGERLVLALQHDQERGDAPMLHNLDAVRVEGKLIASERIARRSFAIWSRILKKAGPPDSKGRNCMLAVYAVFLLIMILTVVPINLLFRRLFFPWRKNAIVRTIAQYEQPSGR